MKSKNKIKKLKYIYTFIAFSILLGISGLCYLIFINSINSLKYQRQNKFNQTSNYYSNKVQEKITYKLHDLNFLSNGFTFYHSQVKFFEYKHFDFISDPIKDDYTKTLLQIFKVKTEQIDQFIEEAKFIPEKRIGPGNYSIQYNQENPDFKTMKEQYVGVQIKDVNSIGEPMTDDFLKFIFFACIIENIDYTNDVKKTIKNKNSIVGTPVKSLTFPDIFDPTSILLFSYVDSYYPSILSLSIKPGVILRESFQKINSQGLHLYLYDTQNDPIFLYGLETNDTGFENILQESSLKKNYKQIDDNLFYNFTFEIGHRNMSLVVYATENFEPYSKIQPIALVLLVCLGFCLSILVLIYSFSIMIKNERKKEEILIDSYNKLMRFMCHALRNPLHSITYFSKNLIIKMINDENKKALEIAKMNKAVTEQLYDLVNTFLDFNQLNKDELKLNNRQTDIVALIRDIYVQFNILKPDNIKITFAYTNNLDSILINVDRIRLRQILNNGMSNAIKVTEEGEICLNLRLSRKKDFVIFNIVDTGTGLKNLKDEDLFIPFTKLSGMNKSINSTSASSGLGLHISRQLAREMKGNVTLTNRKDNIVGADFKLSIPNEILSTNDELV